MKWHVGIPRMDDALHEHFHTLWLMHFWQAPLPPYGGRHMNMHLSKAGREVQFWLISLVLGFHWRWFDLDFVLLEFENFLPLLKAIMVRT